MARQPEPKSCGNCRWWELRVPFTGLGWCKHPIPACVDENTATCTWDKDGTTCPCHERKETEQ